MKYCYSGEDLQNTKIKCGDSLQTCVEKVNDFLLENEDIDLSWLNEFKDELCEKPPICIECKRNPSLTYCGKPLPIIGIQSGDHYDLVFEKIDEYLSTIGGSVVITNSDDSYLIEVDCGQELILPNVNNVDSDGSVVSTPAQTPFICTPQTITEIVISDEDGNELVTTSTDYTVNNSTYQLQNTNNTILLNGQILAEGSELIIAPDATIQVFNSLGVVLNSGVVASGSSGTMLIGNSIVTLVDTLGNVLNTFSIPAEGSLIITAPDTEIDVEVNGIVVVSDTTTDVSLGLIDQDANVVPFTQVGNDLVVNIPVAGVSAMPFKTGQTTSYDSGDDGDTQRGRPFFTLPIVGGVQQLNHFGSKWRFTGITGGYYDRDTSQYKDVGGVVTTRALAYPDDLRCDWSTLDWNDDFILWYFPDLGSQTPLDWEDSIDWADSLNIGGFNDFYLPNTMELYTLSNRISGFLQSHELCLDISTVWSSTGISTYGEIVTNGNEVTSSFKTNLFKHIALRIANLSEL